MSHSMRLRADMGAHVGVLAWMRVALMRAWRTCAQTARLAIGIPDYGDYLVHMRAHHPEREPMSRDAFFVERMQARYGKGRSRCC